MKILVINEQSKDVFSERVLGKELSFERATYSSAIQLINSASAPFEIILLINERIEGAVKIKSLSPSSRVISANGGSKSFTPFITVVYGKNDHDTFSYRDEADFNRLICSQEPRPVKLLKFFKEGRGQNQYKINIDAASKEVEGKNYDLSLFIDGIIFLSRHYLEWNEKWLNEVSKMTFDLDVTFNRDKKIKNIVVQIKNEYRGLPIFKEGDKLTFHEDYNSKVIATATILQMGDGEMLVSFTEAIRRKRLEKVTLFRPEPQFLYQKIKGLTESLRHFESFSGHVPVDSPADYIANAQLARNFNETVVPYTTPIFFSKDTERILRDSSQVRAFVDCLGFKYFHFIIGPAGTGKTFVTAALTQHFVGQDKIILLLSHSNLGVDNLILEVAKHLEHKRIFRFGNDPGALAPEARTFHCLERQNKNFFDFPDDSPRIAEKRFLKEILDKKEGLVLSCTLDSYKSILNLKELKIEPDIVIVDEASRGTVEFIPAIIAAREKIIFIGDNRQLGNIAPSTELTTYLQEKVDKLPDNSGIRALALPKSIVEYFNKGFFNSLIELGYFKPNLLNCNRRSLINISNLVSGVFYEGRLVPGRFDPYNPGKIIFLDTRDVPKFKEERKGTSYFNPIEASYLVTQFIPLAVSNIKKGGEITDLVIISPYMGQIHRFKRILRKHLLFNPDIKARLIRIILTPF